MEGELVGGDGAGVGGWVFKDGVAGVVTGAVNFRLSRLHI